MIALLKYWQIFAGAGAMFILGMILHTASIQRLEREHTEKLAAQVQFDINQCEEAKEVTKESNEYYQNTIAQRDHDIAELRKRPAKCVYVRSANDPKSGSIQSGSGDGLPSEVLYKFAGYCEADRAGLDTLQRYNEKVRHLTNKGS